MPATSKLLSNPSHAMTITVPQALSDIDRAALRYPYYGYDGGTTRGTTTPTRSNLSFPPINGITPGKPATDENGKLIRDAHNRSTIVQTGLYRQIALDANGSPLVDHLGRMCFLAENTELNFAKDPDELSPNTFMREWHHATQIEYLMARGSQIGITRGKQVIIGNKANPQITAVLSHDRRDVYILEALRVEDISRMSKQDQEIINSTSVFQLKVKTDLGLQTLSTAKNPNGIYSVIEQYKHLNMLPDYGTGANSHAVAQRETGKKDSLYMNDVHTNVFKELIDLLLKKMDNSLFVDPSFVNSEFLEIRKMYERIKAFGLGTINGNEETITQHTNVLNYVRSNDHGAKIKSGFTTFMKYANQLLEQEKQLINALDKVEQIGTPGSLALLHRFRNYIMETKNFINIEFSKQLSELIVVYTRMQKLTNRVGSDDARDGSASDPHTYSIDNTSGGTSTSGGSQYPGKLGSARLETDGVASDLYIVSMFEDKTVKRAKHPIEMIFGFTRPTTNNIGGSGHPYLNYKQRIAYDKHGVELSAIVDLLNQRSELGLKRIASQTRKTTRSFDLATQTLRRAREMLLGITKSISTR